jgi:septal ring factor EnvC (AmiA/AmiB activator)
VCENREVTSAEPTREELEATIATLREEVARLREEIRKSWRVDNEVPPHYL